MQKEITVYRNLGFIVVLLTAASPCHSQTLNPEDWHKLIDANKCEDARKLCEPFVADSVPVLEQAEAQKCMSNVALCGHSTVDLVPEKNKEISLVGGYESKAVDEALVHLNKGIELDPQDLSIHQGRLYTLESAGRFNEMVRALDESCDRYKGKDGLQAWLAYAPELYHLHEIETDIEFMKVLDKHYPDNSDVLGNLGTFLDASGKTQEGIPILERAVRLSPSDGSNTWDLAIAYEHAGRIGIADRWYQKGLGLSENPEDKRVKACSYGHFVDEKLKDGKRACELESKNCQKDNRPACKPAKIGAGDSNQ